MQKTRFALGLPPSGSGKRPADLVKTACAHTHTHTHTPKKTSSWKESSRPAISGKLHSVAWPDLELAASCGRGEQTSAHSQDASRSRVATGASVVCSEVPGYRTFPESSRASCRPLYFENPHPTDLESCGVGHSRDTLGLALQGQSEVGHSRLGLGGKRGRTKLEHLGTTWDET